MVSSSENIPTPVKRGLYAFLQRKGEFLLFVKEEELSYRFMQLPDRFEFYVTKNEFQKAMTKNTLDFIEQIPEEVYEVSIANIIKKD